MTRVSGLVPAPSRPADVGMLCVHGIGVQVEGETLRNVAAPLLDELERGGASVDYGETVLKPRQQLDPQPARLVVDLSESAADGPISRRVLMAESHWADVFDAPSYSQLLGWLMSHGTWIAIRHAVFSLSSPVRWLERRYDTRGIARPDWVGVLDIMVGYVGALVSVFLVALPMQLFLLLVGALSYLPFLWTNTLAKRVALGASSILGDASIYSSDSTLRQAILTRVRRDLEWVVSQTRERAPIVILAHSQGAAVVFDLLSSMGDLSRFRLITYGEGIRKLAELGITARRRPLVVSASAWLWLFALLVLVMLRFGVVYVVSSFATPGAAVISDRVGSLLLTYLLGAWFAMTLIYILARAAEHTVSAPVARGTKALLDKHLQWVDLYASADPVPRGPLLGDTPMANDPQGWKVSDAYQGFRSRRVVNRLSTAGDHTSYWQTPNDFVPLVAATLREWVGLPWVAPVVSGRLWRLRFRRGASWSLAVVAALTFWRAGDPLRDIVWARAWNLLPLDPAALTSQTITRYGLRSPALVVAGLVSFLVIAMCYGRFVLDPAWLGWERSVIDRPRGAHPTARPFGPWLMHWMRWLAPWARMFACALLIVAPIMMLFGAIRSGSYGPTLESVTSLAEWGRAVAGWIWVTIFYAAVLVVVIGSAAWLYERRARRPPT